MEVGFEHEPCVEMSGSLDEAVDVALGIDDQADAIVFENVGGVSQTGSWDDGDVHEGSEVRRVTRTCQFRPKRRRRREFVTTETEENAIAPAAIIGLRNPRAASGIAAVL